MDKDLHHIIKSSELLYNDHCKYFLFQLFRGLKYLHSANILHRDLKLGNLLVNASCALKICDFGLARTSRGNDQFMIDYVNCWYRALELLLCCDNYGTFIDVWYIGCIFVEILDCIHRLSHKLMVNFPYALKRGKILRAILPKEDFSPDVDFDAIAIMADEYTGSNLKNLGVIAAHQIYVDIEKVALQLKYGNDEKFRFALSMAEAGYFRSLMLYLKERADMSKFLVTTTLCRIEFTAQRKVSFGINEAIKSLVEMFNAGKMEAKLSVLQNKSYIIKVFLPTGISLVILQENMNSNVGENVIEVNWQEQEPMAKEIEGIDSGRTSQEFVVSSCSNAKFETVSRFDETNEKIVKLISAEEVVKSSADEIEGLQVLIVYVEELYFMSNKAIFMLPKAICGGILICYPQFATQGVKAPVVVQQLFAYWNVLGYVAGCFLHRGKIMLLFSVESGSAPAEEWIMGEKKILIFDPGGGTLKWKKLPLLQA